MTNQEFSLGMDKLKTTFGESYFPESRLKVFYSEFKNTDSRIWNESVSKLIAEESRPPMAKEIRMAIAACRDKYYAEKKRKESQEWENVGKNLPTDTEKELFAAIKMRLMGQMPDDDWKAFMKMLTGAYGPVPLWMKTPLDNEPSSFKSKDFLTADQGRV